MVTNLFCCRMKNATGNGAGTRKLHSGDGLCLWVYLDARKYWQMRYWQVGERKSLSDTAELCQPQISGGNCSLSTGFPPNRCSSMMAVTSPFFTPPYITLSG
ncbi:MAG: hypothetical protein FD134_2695 [Gallionellaceae bacterium]|nr:MAG: hypothetical protein FD134_2695 [Gallionellaceae bacterium]